MNYLKNHSIHLRKLSTAIYLQHFPFILLFDLYLKKGTIIDISLTLLFCLVSYYLLNKVLPSKAIKILYGN